jgi:hypothetical protein
LIQIIVAGPCLCAETDAEFLARYKRIYAAHRRGELRIVGESEEQATLRRERAKLEMLKEFEGPSSFVVVTP